VLRGSRENWKETYFQQREEETWQRSPKNLKRLTGMANRGQVTLESSTKLVRGAVLRAASREETRFTPKRARRPTARTEGGNTRVSVWDTPTGPTRKKGETCSQNSKRLLGQPHAEQTLPSERLGEIHLGRSRERGTEPFFRTLDAAAKSPAAQPRTGKEAKRKVLGRAGPQVSSKEKSSD